LPEPDLRPAADPRKAADDLARLWTAASEQVFTTGVHQPDIYVRTTRLVAAVVQELRGHGRGIEVLLGVWPEHSDLVRRVARSSDLLTTDGLDVEAVAGAAFAMRYREVLEETTLGDRLAALAAAPAGTGWLVLEESGYGPGDPFVPYRRLEADARTGRALLVTTRPDDAFTTCVHVVEQGFIDLETGRLMARGPHDAGQGVQEVGSGEEREALVERLKCWTGGDITG
jgi:hypothetical protein